jgi:predicted RecB family nuclease
LVDAPVDAFESMVLYWDYLKSGDETVLRKAVDYNEDDCKAMIHVDGLLADNFSLGYRPKRTS